MSGILQSAICTVLFGKHRFGAMVYCGLAQVWVISFHSCIVQTLSTMIQAPDNPSPILVLHIHVAPSPISQFNEAGASSAILDRMLLLLPIMTSPVGHAKVSGLAPMLSG